MGKIKPYVKTDWVPGLTPVTRENMTNIEEQVESITNVLVEASSTDKSAGAIVVRNSEGKVEGDIAGNSGTTTKFDKKKLLKVTGVVNGQVQFDGSEEGDKIEIATTLDKGYQQLLDQKLECFLNTKHMQGCPTLGLGQYCYVINDIVVDGSRLYEVIDYAGEVKLDNGLWARLVPRKTITGDLSDLMFALTEKILEGLKSLQDYVITAENGGNAEFLRGFIPADFRRTVEKLKSGDFSTSSDADKIKLINLSDEVIRAMSGNSPVRPEIGSGEVVTEKIADGSVTVEKVDFIERLGNNIINPDTYVHKSMFVDNLTGKLRENASYDTIDYVPIMQERTYMSKVTHRTIAFYDERLEFISGLSTTESLVPFTTPAKSAYARFTIRSGLDITLVGIGEPGKPIDRFRQLLKYSDRPVDELRLVQPNMVDPKELLKNYTIQYADGSITQIAGSEFTPRYTTGKIPVEPGRVYNASVTSRFCSYDENDKPIGAVTDGIIQEYSPPEGTSYIRLTSPQNFPPEQIYFGLDKTHRPQGILIDSNQVIITNLSGVVLDDQSVPNAKLISVDAKKLIQAKFNLAPPESLVQGYYVSQSTGELSANSLYCATDFIPVVAGETYIRNYQHQTALYDTYKRYVGFVPYVDNEIGQTKTLSIPADERICFIRATVAIGMADKFFITRGDKHVKPGTVLIEDIATNFLNQDDAVKSENLYNSKTETMELGFYVNWVNGNLTQNPQYKTSGYISVEELSEYCSNQTIRMLAWYSEDHIYVSGVDNPTNPLSAPKGAKYFRFSISSKIDESTIMLNKGSRLLPFEPSEAYNLTNLFISENQVKKNTRENDDKTIMVKLPSEIHVAVGREMELYNRNVASCINIQDFFFEWICSKGKNTTEKFYIAPVVGDVGTHNLTLNIYNSLRNIVFTANTKLIIAPQTIPTEKTILCIGDSLTNDKPWYSEVKTLSDNKLIFVGSRGGANKHEGRSGYSSNGYVTDSGYGYQGNYKIKVTGVLTVEPQVKKQYQLPLSTGLNGTFDVEEVKLENEATWIYLNRLSGGGDVKPNSVAVGLNTSVVGDNTISYSEAVITSRNPFWNPVTNEVDFNYYSNTYNIQKPDVVQIWLGANETVVNADFETSYNTTITTTMNNVKILVDKILSQWVGTKIMLVLNQYWADQSGMGQGYGANSRNEMTMRVGTFAMNKAYIDKFENYHNDVVICSGGLLLDSVYNYPFKEVSINPRNPSIKVRSYTDWVHPSVEGYLQMADSMYSTISYVLNK